MTLQLRKVYLYSQYLNHNIGFWARLCPSFLTLHRSPVKQEKGRTGGKGLGASEKRRGGTRNDLSSVPFMHLVTLFREVDRIHDHTACHCDDISDEHTEKKRSGPPVERRSDYFEHGQL